MITSWFLKISSSYFNDRLKKSKFGLISIPFGATFIDRSKRSVIWNETLGLCFGSLVLSPWLIVEMNNEASLPATATPVGY
jgi:hypothetical protein